MDNKEWLYALTFAIGYIFTIIAYQDENDVNEFRLYAGYTIMILVIIFELIEIFIQYYPRRSSSLRRR